MNSDSRIFIAGHRGLVGSACCRVFQNHGFRNLVTRTRQEVDLQDRQAVDRFYKEARPEYVIVAAAKVGGIGANSRYPVEFLVDNLEIEINLIRGAYEAGVKKLLFLGSSCIYPKMAEQPIAEESLLGGHLEPTNAPYAIAKIAGISLCQAYARQYGAKFISAMPTNLYGIGDNFHPENSHVLPALLRRFDEAARRGDAEVVVWGSGAPLREFLFADDLAEACLFLLQNYESPEILNVGYGEDLPIKELAEKIAALVGFKGKIVWDRSRPDGTPRKLIDSAKIRGLGWKPRTSLDEGLAQTYAWWRSQEPAPASA